MNKNYVFMLQSKLLWTLDYHDVDFPVWDYSLSQKIFYQNNIADLLQQTQELKIVFIF